MSCIFLSFDSFLNVFHCFVLCIHKCHSQLYLHPSAKECSKWLKQCLCGCVFISFSNNAWGERNSESSFWVLNIYTMRILQHHRVFASWWGHLYSSNAICRRFVFSEKFEHALILMEHTFCLFFFLATRDKKRIIFVRCFSLSVDFFLFLL